MEFGEVVRRRRMVRAYDGRPVTPEALRRILDAARRAPSAGFSQGTAFVVVTDPGLRDAVAGVCGEDRAVERGLPRWVSTAPALVVPCTCPAVYTSRYAEPDKRGSRPLEARPVPWWWVDAGQALMLVLLAATDEGLAAGLLDVADHDGLRALLRIPAEVIPLGVVTIGHPAPDRRSSSLARGRRPPEQVIHHDRWTAD